MPMPCLREKAPGIGHLTTFKRDDFARYADLFWLPTSMLNEPYPSSPLAIGALLENRVFEPTPMEGIPTGRQRRNRSKSYQRLRAAPCYGKGQTVIKPSNPRSWCEPLYYISPTKCNCVLSHVKPYRFLIPTQLQSPIPQPNNKICMHRSSHVGIILASRREL